MKEPTQEQKKELLEWCGFKLRCPPEKDAYKRGIWDYPDGMIGDVDLDLNNLFKYAVPFLDKTHHLTVELKWNRFTTEVWLLDGFGSGKWIGEDDDPALALFWALWQVREVSNSKEEKH